MSALLNSVHASWRSAWAARSPRERLFYVGVALIVGAIVLMLSMQSVDRARAQLRTQVATLRAQAERLGMQATEFERLRAAPPVAVSTQDLRTLLQAQISAAGLSRALSSIESADANHVKVTLGSIRFADWLDWVARLEAQHIRVDACRIEALSTPGLVSVTATLGRARPG
jgi:general secretion pathway protein M